MSQKFVHPDCDGCRYAAYPDGCPTAVLMWPCEGKCQLPNTCGCNNGNGICVGNCNNQNVAYYDCRICVNCNRWHVFGKKPNNSTCHDCTVKNIRLLQLARLRNNTITTLPNEIFRHVCGYLLNKY